MIGMDPLILFGILLALALNFVNGLNDASHSIATVVATKALSPAKAVLLTALCNLAGPYLFTTAVAATIGTAIVGKTALTPLSIVVAMGTAIVLVFVATRSGIPISSSHAMVGGLLGIVLFIFISPVIGMVGAFVFDILISHLFRHSRRNRMRRIFQPLHVLACLAQATAHGANDGQHAVGVITALLVASGVLAVFAVPDWVLLSSAIAIGLGTCFGGWQVVDKMAKEITKIRPYQGFCAATASSAILVSVTRWGIPVSSTHAINGAIVGVGATRGKNAVQWRVVREMVTAWIITIPLAMIIAYSMYFIADFFINLL